MKELITAAEIKNHALRGKQQLLVGPASIVTPAAKDSARDLGVELVYSLDKPTAEYQQHLTQSVCEPVVESKGTEDLVSLVAQNIGDQSVSPELVGWIVKEVIAALKGTNLPTGPVTEKDKSGLRLVRGETVICEPFSTGNPRDRVFLKDLLPLEDSPNMAAGMMKMENSAFEWELKYDEYDYVIEGELEIIVDGTSYLGKPGDVFFIPKGTKIVFSSPGTVKFLYVTYPANWQDQV
ncbi:Ethanolamine utilization EutQ family protein [Desulforamulus reducens MI-1]|uniref:Ethanolamine utilization EutQ family protein n=1 Tax=Desulforamulus reducens (strain ATCC BAA-1160 / DSM 100696 / MI-1) TaxID=349161 RepID=A4J435_DESRM|nr:cupin domain-containing protein [Desulforamulus reducens]ABO49838.1 Ethanolamine utilization EutQ family protein [Desulforamulus reducens MI-1]